MTHKNEKNLCRKRQKKVEHLFSILYTEHNVVVNDGAYKQESLYMRNEQTDGISTLFSLICTKVDTNRDYGT